MQPQPPPQSADQFPAVHCLLTILRLLTREDINKHVQCGILPTGFLPYDWKIPDLTFVSKVEVTYSTISMSSISDLNILTSLHIFRILIN